MRKAYEIRLGELLSRSTPEARSELLALQHRLRENLDSEEQHGPTAELSHERSVIVAALDKISLDTLGASFQDLSPVPLRPELAALVDYRFKLQAYCESFPLPDLPRAEFVIPLRGTLDDSLAAAIADVLRQSGKRDLLIEGSPGSGKSTLLRLLARSAENAPEQVGFSEPYLPLLLPLAPVLGTRGALEQRIALTLAEELNLLEPLPNGFLREWTQSTGKTWLFLLDGLDELPPARWEPALGIIKSLRDSMPGSRMVVTSRDTGLGASRLNGFAHIRILDLELSQVEAYALQLFGSRSPAFLSALGSQELWNVSPTPLLLGVAARVFAASGDLPQAYAALYRDYVDICLREAIARGLDNELGPRLAGPQELHITRLGAAAVALTEKPEAKAAELERDFARYLEAGENFGSSSALSFAAQYLPIMARRSALLIRSGERYLFTHATMRQYLAACALDGGLAANDADLIARLKNWAPADIRQIAILIVRTRSVETRDVTELLKLLFETGSGAHLLVGRELAAGAVADAELWNRVVNALLTSSGKAISSSLSFEAAAMLRRLAERRNIAPLVAARLFEAGFDYISRLAFLDLLAAMRAHQELLQFAVQPVQTREDYQLAKEAIWHVARHTPGPETARRYLELALRQKTLGAGVPPIAAAALLAAHFANEDPSRLTGLRRQSGDAELSSALAWLVRSETIDDNARQEAWSALDRLGFKDTLAELDASRDHSPAEKAKAASSAMTAGDPQAEAEFLRLATAEGAVSRIGDWILGRLIESGHRPEALAALLEIVKDGSQTYAMQQDCISIFVQHGCAEELVQLTQTRGVITFAILKAAQGLLQLNRVTEAATAFEKLAGARGASDEERIDAARELGRLGRIPEMARILVKEAKHATTVIGGFDPKEWEPAAIAALAEFGCAAELLTITKDSNLSLDVRVPAARRAGLAGPKQEAIAILADLVLNATEVSGWRVFAAEFIQELGDPERARETLLQLIRSPNPDAFLTARAAAALDKLGAAAEAVAALLQQANDPETSVIDRIQLGAGLAQLGALKEADRILVSTVTELFMGERDIAAQAVNALVESHREAALRRIAAEARSGTIRLLAASGLRELGLLEDAAHAYGAIARWSMEEAADDAIRFLTADRRSSELLEVGQDPHAADDIRLTAICLAIQLNASPKNPKLVAELMTSGRIAPAHKLSAIEVLTRYHRTADLQAIAKADVPQEIRRQAKESLKRISTDGL